MVKALMSPVSPAQPGFAPQRGHPERQGRFGGFPSQWSHSVLGSALGSVLMALFCSQNCPQGCQRCRETVGTGSPLLTLGLCLSLVRTCPTHNARLTEYQRPSAWPQDVEKSFGAGLGERCPLGLGQQEPCHRSGLLPCSTTRPHFTAPCQFHFSAARRKTKDVKGQQEASPRCPPVLHAARDTRMLSCFGKNASAGRARSVSACFDINVSVSPTVLQRVCVCAPRRLCPPCPPALCDSVFCFWNHSHQRVPSGGVRSRAQPHPAPRVVLFLPLSAGGLVGFPLLSAHRGQSCSQSCWLGAAGGGSWGCGPRQDRGQEVTGCSVI